MILSPTRPLLVAGALIALAGCGADRPTAPAPGEGPPASFRVAMKLGEGVAPGTLGTLTDTLAVSVHDSGRRIAGPLETLPDSVGRFTATLEAPSGPDRVVAIEALGVSYLDNTEREVRGTILLGLSDPFTLEPDSTDSVTVTFTPFTTDFIQPSTVYTGTAQFSWMRVPSATGYRVRETLADSSVVDRTTADTTITVAAASGDANAPRAFQVRAENRFAEGAWSAPIVAIIAGQPGAPTWTTLDDGSGPGPGTLFQQGGAFDPGGRTFYVYGGITSDTVGVADSTLWTFSVASPGWVALASGGGSGPGPRYGAALAVAPDGSRIFLFSGISTRDFSSALDLWSYDPSSGRWLLLESGASATAAGIPSEAETEGFLWAAAGNDHLGLYAAGTGQVFTFNLGQRVWSEVPATGGSPAPRTAPAVDYDPASASLALFGGQLDSTDSLTAEFWTYSETSGSWTEILPSGGGGPPARSFSSAAFAPGLGLLVTGGLDSDLATFPWDDVWLYRPAGRSEPEGWERVIPPGGLGYRLGAVAGFDEATRSLVITGGLTFEHSVWSIGIP